MASKNNIRSISFPSRSHPSTLAVEEELNKLRALETSSSTSTSETIYAGLSGLEELYRFTDDLLNMASTRQVLSQRQSHSLLEEFLDGSVRLMDICSVSRDLMLETSANVRALQSAVRRRKGHTTIEGVLASYGSLRRNMKKEARKLNVSLRRMENKAGASSPLTDQDQHLTAVIHALREVNSITVSIFQSLVSFLSSTEKSGMKRSKWSLVSKLLHKGEAVACEEQQENEIESVSAALLSGEDYSALRRKLEALETSIDGIEKCLESVFRRLIRTRASLLNTMSQ